MKVGEIRMTTTQAEAAVMARTAERFDQVGLALDGMLRRLMGELETLRTQWQGAGGRSFDQVKTAWAHDQELLHRTLTETAEAIRRSATHYDATDSTAASRLAPARVGGMTLPL
jgi:WXG100 family type VII secretion target